MNNDIQDDLLNSTLGLASNTLAAGLYPWDLGVHNLNKSIPAIVYQEPAQVIDLENRLLKIKVSPLSLFLDSYNLSRAYRSNTVDHLELGEILGESRLKSCQQQGWVSHDNDIELDSGNLLWRISEVIKTSGRGFESTRNLIDTKDKYDFLSHRQYETFGLRSLTQEHTRQFCVANALDNRQSNLAVSLCLKTFAQQYGIFLEPEDNSFLAMTWQRDLVTKNKEASSSFKEACLVGIMACNSLVEIFKNSINTEYNLSEFTISHRDDAVNLDEASHPSQEMSQ